MSLTPEFGDVLAGLAVRELHPDQPADAAGLRSVRKQSPRQLHGAGRLRGQPGRAAATADGTAAGDHHAAGRCSEA